MSTPLDFDRHPHGCEIVVPIVLKIPIYIEPIVIEKTPACHGHIQPAKVSFESKALASEPAAALNDDIQAVTSSNVNVRSRFSWTQPWKSLLFGSSGILLAALSAIYLR
ncbi:hypothetical protein IQ260_23525 [Leptolyngbya cf. ectocarpi LEGE 11479]|uniref:Uncharacterized protein n=1 Tax=Leptolyngbya cf. ectocarpi LEGE 11479 TaxID=1828722 RepID=A0A929F924_LEPEC|nr:hypothetical protein [Leptolyngbya ectocarpi]MBE9069620.1 hypothetical protein [Leptolyngbya cf. ectocarpi LEGE 11479]